MLACQCLTYQCGLRRKQKQQLLRLNVLELFMLVSLDDGTVPPIKYQYAELSKLYAVVSQLVRCCDVSEACHSSYSVVFYVLCLVLTLCIVKSSHDCVYVLLTWSTQGQGLYKTTPVVQKSASLQVVMWRIEMRELKLGRMLICLLETMLDATVETYIL